MNMRTIINILGIDQAAASHTEKIVSGLGASVAIFLIYWISHALIGDAAMLVVASMGASAVLLFAVPHGPLSQPWPLIGGNLIPAAVGVTCAQLISDPFAAAALAVGSAVTVMYYLKCLHPPGGATALVAVVSGPDVMALGYTYVLTPVAINVCVILAVALGFNALFKWRRYPAAWASQSHTQPQQGSTHRYSHAGLEHAFSQLDSFIDISEEELLRICELASAYDKKNSCEKRG